MARRGTSGELSNWLDRNGYQHAHARKKTTPPYVVSSRMDHATRRGSDEVPKFSVGDIVRRTATRMRSMGLVSGPVNGIVVGYSGKWPLIRWSNMAESDEPMAQAEEGLELDKRAMSQRQTSHARKPKIMSWIRGYPNDRIEVYVYGPTRRSDEGEVGHDMRVRPTRLGPGPYTMVVSPDDLVEPSEAHARVIHQEPTGRPVFAAHERDHHITTAGRRALSADQFALPPGPEEKRRGLKGRLPIDTLKRGRNALARAAQMRKRGEITGTQLAAAQRKVHAAWPSIESAP